MAGPNIPMNLESYQVNQGNPELVAIHMQQWEARAINNPLGFTAENHLKFTLGGNPDKDIQAYFDWLSHPSDKKISIIEEKLDLIFKCAGYANLILAGINMSHYLHGSGLPLYYDRDEMRKFEIIREKEQILKEYIVNSLEKHRLSEKSTKSFADHFDAAITTGEAIRKGGADFTVAFGASAMKAHAVEFVLKPKKDAENTISIEGLVNFHFWDIYDYRDPEVSVPVFGSDVYMFYLELWGSKKYGRKENSYKARQFAMRAEWTVKFIGEYKLSTFFFNRGKWLKQEWRDHSKKTGIITNRSAAEIGSYDNFLILMGVVGNDYDNYIKRYSLSQKKAFIPSVVLDYSKGKAIE